MPVPRTLSVVILLGLLAAPGFALPVAAAEVAQRACLNRADQRAAVATQKAVPLATAIKSLRERGHRAEVVRAALCNRGEKLVYVLTLLARSGKVTRATVDAANGEPMTGQ
jgi:hypothetical protein